MKVFAVIQTPNGLIKKEAEVPEGTTVSELTEQLKLAPEEGCGLSIFGQRCTAETVLQPADRLEISLPLRIDPKEARRLRAAQKNAAVQKKHVRRHAGTP